jgi:hypothetical protein
VTEWSECLAGGQRDMVHKGRCATLITVRACAIEHAQAITAHESPRTTKRYDRTGDAITLDEVERMLIFPARGKGVNLSGNSKRVRSDG